MGTITGVKDQPDAVSPAQIAADIDDVVRRRLSDCCYGFVFEKVTWHVDNTTLTLDGCVPSFYLKQVLQELLRTVEGVGNIENNVEVVSSTGLSSDRPNTRQ